jgi:uncharacterized cupredoxin-like copper-binding protein
VRLTGRRGRGRAALALVAAASCTVLLAVTAFAAATASGSEVSIALVEWKLLPGQITVRPGRVTFVVRNRGTMDHEFLILRSDRHHHSLAVKKGRAVETGRFGEIPLIPRGATKRITLRVPRGTYVLLCNLIGHYQAGQYASLRVR